MRKSWLVWSAVLPLCLFVGVRAEAAKKPKQVIVGYILAGRGTPLDPATIAGTKVTRFNYAFFRLQDGVMASTGVNDMANLAVLNGLKKDNPGLEVVVSVGGGGNGSAGFSDMAITAEGGRSLSIPRLR